MRADGHIPEVVMVSCNGIVATVKWDYKKKGHVSKYSFKVAAYYSKSTVK